MRHYNIPIFVSHFGCTNDCVFCNQKKITGRIKGTRPSEVRSIVEKHLQTIEKQKEDFVEVAFFGGSFTGIEKSEMLAFLKEVQPYIVQKKIDGIRVSTRPDYISDDIVEILLENGVSTVELGVQSMDTNVLIKSGRGHGEEEVISAVNLLKKKEICVVIQLMPGLPGADYSSDLKSVEKVIKLKPDSVRIYPTLVICNTKLEDSFKKGKYIPMSLEEAIERTMYMLIEFESAGIKVIRVGLQPSEDLRKKGVIIAGPFHSAFRELVEGEIYKRFILKKSELERNNEVEINPKDLSKILGINRRNLKVFGERIKILRDAKIDRSDIVINKEKYTREEIIAIVKLRVGLDEADNN